jgi:hypothetical protein
LYTYYIKPPVYYYILTFENVRGFQGAARLVVTSAASSDRRVEEKSLDAEADDSNEASLFRTPRAGREKKGEAAPSTDCAPPGVRERERERARARARATDTQPHPHPHIHNRTLMYRGTW